MNLKALRILNELLGALLVGCVISSILGISLIALLYSP